MKERKKVQLKGQVRTEGCKGKENQKIKLHNKKRGEKKRIKKQPQQGREMIGETLKTIIANKKDN